MSRAVEGHIEVTRRARYWSLGADVTEPAETWFVLHGYRQLAERFLRRFRQLDDGTRTLIAPEALSRFYVSPEPGRHGPESVVGATWMTREDREHEIADYVEYLDRLSSVTTAAGARVTVLGFSQGVATAARWSTLGALRPERLILWGDTLPPDLDVGLAREAWRDVEVVLVRGTGDPAITEQLVEREREQLSAVGRDYRLVTYEGGHDIDQRTLLGLVR